MTGPRIGTVVVGASVSALAIDEKLDILRAVRRFGTFTPDNDPCGEHDFSSIELDRIGRIFWKIDYYEDERCEYGAEYPADADRSFRVLTITLAEEY